MGEGGPEADAEVFLFKVVGQQFGQFLNDFEDAQLAGFDDGFDDFHVVHFEGEFEESQNGLYLLHSGSCLFAEVATHQLRQLVQYLHLAVLLELLYAYYQNLLALPPHCLLLP